MTGPMPKLHKPAEVVTICTLEVDLPTRGRSMVVRGSAP